MKIAYISYPAFADCDVPFIASLQHNVDVTYILCVSEGSRHQTLLNVGKLQYKSGIYSGNEIGGLENIEKYIDISKVYICWEKNRNRIDMFRTCLKLCMFLKSQKFSGYHITWPLGYTSFPLYYFRKKMILTVHDPLPHSSNLNMMSQLYRRIAFFMVDNLLLLNNVQRDIFQKHYGLNNKNIIVSRLSIYYHLADIDVKTPQESNYILFFGQISSYKGLDVLCESMRLVRRSIPSYKLIVAGKGDIYFDINQYIEDGTIIFKNYYIPNDELAGLIRNASFVVCPYIDATQSGVIMSSFSLQTPVIVSEVGALPEMLNYGKLGLVVPPGDKVKLADAILNLLRNPSLLEKFRNNIRQEYFDGNSSWNYIAINMKNRYKECGF